MVFVQEYFHYFFLIFFLKKKKLNELQTEVFTSSFMQIAANKLGATQESDEESLLKKKSKYLSKTMDICIMFNLLFFKGIYCVTDAVITIHFTPSQKSLTCILI